MRCSTILALAALLSACGASQPTPEPANINPRTPELTNRNEPPREPAFVASGVRCIFAPENELASCEEISPLGAGSRSAVENCALIGSRLDRGPCPTENEIGTCITMDGPDFAPVYPIRIHYYRSSTMASSDAARVFCNELSGTFTPLP